MKPSSISIVPLFALATFYLQGTTDALLHHSKYKASPSDDVITGRYIVEFANQEAANPFVHSLSTSFEHDVKIHEQFKHDLFHGLSFNLHDPNPSLVTASSYDEKLQELFDHEHVTAVYPIRAIQRPELTAIPVTNQNENIAQTILPHQLTQVDRVHKELKNTGKGIVVGIIDSGVDYKHPALGGGFGKGYKVRYGEDLVGDKYDSNQPNPIVRPGPTPLDNCGAASGASGHGTHVSGIVAGSSANFTGVAPDATLGMWRVFGCTGSTGNDIIIKALLKAYDAGSDIISLSLGDNSGWSEGPDTIVASRIAKKGVPVVIAAGNAGQSGAFTVGSPSTGEGVISVASFDNAHNLVYKFKATGFSDAIAYASSQSGKFPSGDIVAGDKAVGGTKDACDPSTIPATVKGNYGLVKRGSCTFSIKSANLAKAGAIGVVVYDNAGGDAFTPSAPDAKVPVMGIAQKDGEALLAAIKKGKVSLTFDGKLSPVPLASAKTVSSFSSVGASYELDLRPNIGAPGGDIYSTLPRYLGSWGMMSGTSMATPYLSGSIALYLKSAKGKNKKGTYIMEEFQNYAYKAPVQNGEKAIDSPLRQGAGLIQVYDTIQQNVHITPGQFSFNDTSSNQYKTQTFTITNHGSKTVSYQISNNVSLSVVPYDLATSGYTYIQPINYTTAAAKLRISKKSIKVAPGKSVKVKVSVIPPHTDVKQHIMYGGYVQLKSSNKKNGLDLSIPYFGVVGRQKDLPIFDQDFPYLSSNSNGTVAYEKNETFVLNRSKKAEAYIITRLLSGTALLQGDVVDVKSHKVIGKAFPDQTYLARNTLNPTEQAQSIPWDGSYYKSGNKPIPVPKGTYEITVRALHIFGNPKKQADFDTWTSGHIRVTN
ncbi:peptidase S8/S53 domain-containing protein [Halteromyces radiatus]|uniref:peptidase S8/S53 domain-containing protein n=1 Tax=Halteromyces radiatus TaxID=101107 RepID=UPI00221E78B0|nr:peptidase S8/S53 domain-containing protein [Halteromyces radiatus]KAI8086543.1 peptidase S8/S53 domain-containing protein [Halteromyces radiatus]